MQPQAIANEPYYCLFAPDGTWQPATLSIDYLTCIAYIKFLHKLKMGKSHFELMRAGFQILPVRLTMTVAGDAEAAFQASKALLK